MSMHEELSVKRIQEKRFMHDKLICLGLTCVQMETLWNPSVSNHIPFKGSGHYW